MNFEDPSLAIDAEMEKERQAMLSEIEALKKKKKEAAEAQAAQAAETAEPEKAEPEVAPEVEPSPAVLNVEESQEAVKPEQSGQAGENNIETEMPEIVPLEDASEVESKTIKDLKKKLEEAKNAYALKEYKTNNAISKIKAFLGIIKTKSDDIKDVSDACTEYKNSASNLLQAQIEELQKGNLTPEKLKEKMGELVKYYNYDEKMSLYAARTNARAENNKDSRAYQALKKSGDFINWYRKVGAKKKMALGVVLSALGVVTGGSSIMLRRGLGSAAAGVGVAVGLEAAQRGMEKMKSELKKEDMMADFENSAEKFEEVMKILNAEINNYEKDLKHEVLMSWIRAGAGVGAAAGTFVVGTYVGEAIKDYFGWGENTPSQDAQIDAHFNKYYQGLPKVANPFDVSETTPGSGPLNDAFERMMEVKKGSSMEGTIIRYLNEHQDLIDKYNNVKELSGGRKFDAGQIAHRMALEYAENHNLPKGPYSLIHEGAQLKFSPDGIHLSGISGDEHWGYLPENKPEINVPGRFVEDAISGESVDAAGGNEESVINRPPNSFEGMGESVDDAAAGEDSDAINKPPAKFEGETTDGEPVSDSAGNNNYAVEGGQDILTADKSSEFAEVTSTSKASLADLSSDIPKKIANPVSVEKIFNQMNGESDPVERVKLLRKYLAGGDALRWSEIAKVPSEQLVSKDSGIFNAFYKNFASLDGLENVKNQIKPSRNETISDWITKTVKVIQKNELV